VATPAAYTGDIDSDIAPPVGPHEGTHHDLGVLSRNLVHLLRERGGRGPTRAKAYWAGEDTLLVLFGDCFTQAEKTLWEAGAEEAADRYRKTVQDVLSDEMRAEVARSLGREVIAVMSCAHHEPDLMAQIFVLAPRDVAAG
jgi:hypothetical protein